MLNSSRYKQFLTAWDGQLLAAGGFVDDVNGKSRPVLNVIALDLNTRTWSSLKNYTWGGDSSGGTAVAGANSSGCVMHVLLLYRPGAAQARMHALLGTSGHPHLATHGCVHCRQPSSDSLSHKQLCWTGPCSLWRV